MPYDTADREAHVASARRRLAATMARGEGYPKGHEPKLWLESVAQHTAQLLTAERLLHNHMKGH